MELETLEARIAESDGPPSPRFSKASVVADIALVHVSCTSRLCATFLCVPRVAERLSSCGPPELAVLEQYLQARSVVRARKTELEAVVSSRDAAQSLCAGLRSSRRTELLAGLATISSELHAIYQVRATHCDVRLPELTKTHAQHLVPGGMARFELVDGPDPSDEGIVFSVRQPGQDWQKVSDLSGDEQVRRENLSSASASCTNAQG